MSILNILVGKIDYIQVVFMYSKSLYYITLLYVFTCLCNYIDIVLCTAYFVFVLTFPHPGLYRIYGNKDDDECLGLVKSENHNESLGDSTGNMQIRIHSITERPMQPFILKSTRRGLN
jgi:hypothetical protein